MKSLRFAVLTLWRDFSSGELRVLALALLVAVGALTAVGFFTSRVSAAVDEQAGEVLAADLRMEAGRPVEPDYLKDAQRRSLQTAQIVSFPSVVFYGEKSNLSAIRAVSAGYPLRGQLKISDAPFADPRVTDRLPASGEVWVDARLLAMLDAPVGATLRVGSSQLRVAQVLEYRPDQGSQFIDVAPTVLMNLSDLPATQLVQTGSRVSYITLFAGAREEIGRFKQDLAARKTSGERLIDIGDASPQIRSATDRAGRFLNLSGLTSVLLAAIAVAMAARRYAHKHLDSVALLKSMGASQRFVMQVTLLELLLLGIAAWIIGSLIGYGAQLGLAWILRDLIRGTLPPASLRASGLGLVVVIAILIGFALPPLLQLRRVPPIRVLRRNAEPPPLSYLVLYGLALAAVVAMLYWITRDAKLVSYVTYGTVATFVVLFAAGWLLVRALQRFRGGVGVAWRYGVANVARRGGESIVQIVAFGLGLMVLLLLAVVRADLLSDWKASLPANAPNYFMINIQPSDADELRTLFAAHSIAAPEFVPMIRARLTRINDTDVTQLKFQDERAKNFLSREANLTWAQQLQADNKITAGHWWSTNDEPGPRVSVETGLAQALGVKVGDRLGYDVAGESIEARVTNLRDVRWDSFKPNFFMVFAPGVLDLNAGMLITSLHLSADQRPVLGELARRFPQITVLDIDAILSQVRQVMDKASLAVEYVFLFTLLAGVAVLLAAIQSTRDERRYESAILRTLGASRRTVLQGVAAEFTALGLLSGVLAATGATIAGYFLATRLFNLKYSADPQLWIIGLVSGVVLVAVSGTLATRSVVNHPPLATLRRE